MKVLQITNNYPSTSNPVFGIFVKEQIDSIISLGVKCDVFIINAREFGKFEYIKGIFRLRKHLSENSYDIVHCHHVLSALVLIFTLKYYKFRKIVSYQNDPINELGRALFFLVHHYFDIVILKSEAKCIKGHKIRILPNGVNTNRFDLMDRDYCKKRLNLLTEKRYILFVSSNFIRKQKRYDLFSEVLIILKNEYNQTDIEELVLTKSIREDVPLYFNASHLHLVTSEFEGSPNSVKEAMACNLQVVSTNVGDTRKLLDGVAGSYVCDTKNPRILAKYVFKALQFTQTLNGRKKIIESKLDIYSIANKLVNIYNSK
jgi:teichuronic acid biosynthesis glycosyltransferase TuaC